MEENFRNRFNRRAGTEPVGLRRRRGEEQYGGERAAGNGAKSGSSGEKITITFQNIYPDPATPSYKTIHALVEEYEASHPNIHIELDTLNTDQQKSSSKRKRLPKRFRILRS
ncbi:hypothetical protein HMSSN139_28970 [Paenibacillus sp. HMSSN-139]|nr:hypothetical protein HMSSN139_28970 [Paenibacillus sp. HMSSN-139]